MSGTSAVSIGLGDFCKLNLYWLFMDKIFIFETVVLYQTCAKGVRPHESSYTTWIIGPKLD